MDHFEFSAGQWRSEEAGGEALQHPQGHAHDHVVSLQHQPLLILINLVGKKWLNDPPNCYLALFIFLNNLCANFQKFLVKVIQNWNIFLKFIGKFIFDKIR